MGKSGRGADVGTGGRRLATAAGSSIDEVGIRRDGCNGWCPVYSVTLRRNAPAVYEGEYFVTLRGRWEADLDPSAFDDLAAALDRNGFTALEPGYDAMVTCMPTTWVWTDGPRGRVEVREYGSAGPQALGSIQEAVDAVAAGLDWRPSGSDSDVGDADAFGADWGEPHWTQGPRPAGSVGQGGRG